MLISRSIPALYGGVSQQAETMRAPSQLEAMDNSWATIVDGLGKRAPSEHVARVSAPISDVHIHVINRDITERYLVVLSNGDLKVFGVDGSTKTVNFPYGKDYLTIPEGFSAETSLDAVTVADYSFILNKTVTTQLAPVDSDRAPQPLGYWDLNSTGGSTTRTQYPKNPAIGAIGGLVQSFQDLPTGAPEGVIFKIQATSQSGFSGYYVQRIGGVWIEVTQPGAQNGILAVSMPWALIRQPDGTFDFAPFSWAPRRVGDDISNPAPTFVGRKINAIFFADNRLGFLVDENIVESRIGDFGNFWRMSALDHFDDDVRDIAATETTVTAMKQAVPMGDSLMLFSDQVQFRLSKNKAVTSPTAVSLNVSTRYPVAIDAKPAALGSDVYFGAENSGWVRLMEYYVRDESLGNEASDVSGHVPRYVPKGLRCIAATADNDAVFLLSKGAENKVFHYKFHWNGETEKAQSAWGTWSFPSDVSILSGACLGEYLYLVVTRPSGTFIERINLSSTATAPYLDYQIHLDRRVRIQGTYYAPMGYTSFTIPYELTEADKANFRIVRGNGFGSGKGGLIDPASYVYYPGVGQTTVQVPVDESAGECLAGFSYTQRWTFSRWFMRNSNNEPDLSGRLQIRTVTLHYQRAGYFQTEVAPYGTNPDVETIVPSQLAEFTGKTLGSNQLLIGSPTFADGNYSFQVYGNADDSVISITNDSHLGAWFTSAEVEFFWQKRSRFQ